ncbi:MAG: hypothetical protein LBI13_00065, partial [Streptococcaceae bacterium]|nr:hypothetical protein [Streptococcaceae bacterium]
YSCHQRKFEEYEERLAYIHHQVRKTTDIFGNTSRHRQNQGFAGEMMGRTMTANNHFSEIIEEVKQTVRTERNRLEDERESLYRKRSELI